MAATVTPTHGESLVIWRRRKRLNQVEAAKEFNVHVDKYRDWEADKGETVPRRHLGKLKTHEVCYLMRRRVDMTQRELAVRSGCTRLWVIMMEDGTAPADRLKHFWKV